MHLKWQVASNLLQSRYLLIVLSVIVISIYTFYEFGSEFIIHDQSVELYSLNNTADRIAKAKNCYLQNSPSISSGSFEINDFESSSQIVKIKLFEDISETDVQPTPDRSIFFIESSCFKNKLAKLNARQACAIESAARWNPHRDVFVLFPSEVGYSKQFSSPIMQSLNDYRNIYFRRINFRNYSIGTPAEGFFSKDTIFESKFLVETFSDILRLITLFKFGGIYLDTDLVVQQNFDVLPANYAGKETEKFIASGAIGLTSNGLGHKIAGIFIKNVCNNFNATIWGYNGPLQITRSLQKICNVNRLGDMIPNICWTFNVLPEEVFYPVPYSQWERYFDANFTSDILQRTNKSVAVHFWNRLSSQQLILKDFKNKTLVEMYREVFNKNKKIQNPIGETAYGVIAKTNCPRAYASSGDLF